MLGLKTRKNKRRPPLNRNSNSARKPKRLRVFRIHPLFWAVGIWYAFTGKLPLFLLSAIVALQHEYAHAITAAKLGYRLNSVVLMPFGAVIDGDLKDVSLKDEIAVALSGPLCNFATAMLFVAFWWVHPPLYPFTDVACYTSLAIATINLLPAYPLDGGRILQCLFTRFFSRFSPIRRAEARANALCRKITLALSILLLCAFVAQCCRRSPNLTLFAFSLFLAVGAFGNRDKTATYFRIDFSCKDALSRGIEIKRVALSSRCKIKDALRFLSRGSYLVLEIYDDDENLLFHLPQNELSDYFLSAKSPYATLRALYEERKTVPKKTEKM